MSLTMVHGAVQGTCAREIPKEGETIADDFDLPKLLEKFKHYCLTKRNGECWVIDFYAHKNDVMAAYYIKLPVNMSDQHIKQWIKPLREAFNQ